MLLSLRLKRGAVLTDKTGETRFILIAGHYKEEKTMKNSWEQELGNSFSHHASGIKVSRGVFTDLCAANDLLQQTRGDDLSLPAISTALRRWALQQDDVEKVAVGYIGTQYSIAVLLDNLQLERISSLYSELEHVWRKFGEYTPLLYPLGPAQRDSLLLNSADCYVVYPAYES